MRAERTRSLSPEKFPSSLNLSSSSSHLEDLKSPSLAPESLKTSSTKLSKAEEIKKTIAAVAGPSGTLPLFPSNNSQALPKATDTPIINIDKKSPTVKKTLADKNSSVKKVDDSKPEFISTSLKHRDVSPDKDLEASSHSKLDDSNIFPQPKLKSISSRPNTKIHTPAITEEQDLFPPIKLKRVVQNPPVEPSDTEEIKSPIPTSKPNGSSSPHVTTPLTPQEPIVPSDAKNLDSPKSKFKPSTPILPKKPSTIIPSPKPRSLSSQKSTPVKSENSEPSKKNPTPVEKSQEEIDKTDDLEVKSDKQEEFKSITLKSVKNSTPVESKSDEFNNGPTIIAPLSSSVYPSTPSSSSSTGLRRFQSTRESNTHSQVSSTVNGRVPMPGMAKSPTNVRSSTATVTTPPPVSEKPKPFASPSSRQSLRPTPNLSPNSSDVRQSLSPAGSFLASRPAVALPRPKSPSRGGFVQSAMLKRENTVIRPRSDSSSSTAQSGNIFDGIILASPSSRISGSRSPSPSRHGRTQSATNIDTTKFATIGGRFYKSQHNSSTSLEPKLSKMSLDDSDIPNISEPEPAEVAEAENDEVHSEKPIPPPSRGSRKSEDKSATSPPLSANHTGSGLKSSDSRRWSPVRQTWLESALMKTSSNSSLESPTLINRIPTVLRAPSPTRTTRGNSINSGKLLKPSIPPSKVLPHHSPALHSVTLSEPTWNEHEEVSLPKLNETEDNENKKSQVEQEEKEEVPVALTDENSNVTPKNVEPPMPPPSRTKSLAQNNSKPLPVKPISMKPEGLSRSATTSLGRGNSRQPAIPKKPDLSSKPALPSDALEKLRALRSNIQSSYHNEGEAQPKSDVEQVKATLRRSNTMQYQSGGTIRRPGRPTPPKSLASRRLKEDQEVKPPLPVRPSERNIDTVREDDRIKIRRGEEKEEEAPPRLPPRKTVIEKHAEPLPPVPSSLKSKPITDSAENSDPVLEARRVLYGPTDQEKEADENFYSNTPNIPSVLNKKTAKSFASDLSAVLQRGSPLVSLKDTEKSFSPSFERMSGMRKSKTFDSSEIDSSYPGSAGRRGAGKTVEAESEQKVELQHLTKARAKGPRGRRLPKTVSGSSSGSTTPTLRTPGGRSGGFKPTHQRQRSRSLSPVLDHSRGYSNVSPSSLSSPLPPRAFVKASNNIDRENETESSQEDIPEAPPSRAIVGKGESNGNLLIPKTRKQLPLPPSPGGSRAVSPLTKTHSHPSSLTPSPLSSPSHSVPLKQVSPNPAAGAVVNLARHKPIIRKSSQSVAKNLQKQPPIVPLPTEEDETIENNDDIAHNKNEPSSPVVLTPSPSTPLALPRKPVKAIPPKPRQLSSAAINN